VNCDAVVLNRIARNKQENKLMEAKQDKDRAAAEKEPPPWIVGWDEARLDDLPTLGGPPGSAGPPHVETVTQKQLTEYLRLQPLAARFAKLKEHLKTALVLGAPVEPGPSTAELFLREVRRLTVEHLIKTLRISHRRLEAARATVIPQAYRYLKVGLVQPDETESHP
jgi:hypothetical protein